VFEETFTKILVLARHMKKLNGVGGAWGDGTKIHANASKHKAVSYKRAGEIIEELREERKQALEEAKAEMEKMYEAAQEEGVNEQKKLKEYQYNFTDGDSRIMKAGNGKHFEQSCNAQAAVDTEGSMLILGGYVTQNANDKKEMEPLVASVDEKVREIKDDMSGYGILQRRGGSGGRK
jgi:vacuolar-type H+-ATPase subunit H